MFTLSSWRFLSFVNSIIVAVDRTKTARNISLFQLRATSLSPSFSFPGAYGAAFGKRKATDLPTKSVAPSFSLLPLYWARKRADGLPIWAGSDETAGSANRTYYECRAAWCPRWKQPRGRGRTKNAAGPYRTEICTVCASVPAPSAPED